MPEAIEPVPLLVSGTVVCRSLSSSKVISAAIRPAAACICRNMGGQHRGTKTPYWLNVKHIGWTHIGHWTQEDISVVLIIDDHQPIVS